MAQEFRLQDPGEGIHEVEIRKLYVASGDTVEDGDDLVAVESDKATVDIPAPFDGVIEDIRVEEGATAQVGDVLLTYREQGESKSGKTSKSAKDESESEKAESATEEKEESEPGKPESETEKEKPEKEEKEKKDKEKEREQKEEKAASKSAEEESKSAETESKSLYERPVPASPATRRAARELGVDLRQVKARGPKGQVTTEDVQAFAESKDTGTAKARPGRREAPELPDFEQWGPVQREKLHSIRRATARQVTQAWSQIPHAIHHDLVDITELEQFRQQHKGRVEDLGGKLTLTPLVIKAIAALLREFPRFNASLDTEHEEIILKKYYHIGVAVQTDRGLLVPVVRDTERKSLAEIAVTLTELAKRTRAGEASRDDLNGGTFTLTNPGPLGGTGFDPIINHPEAAILGLGKAQLQPTVQGTLDDYNIAPRLMLPIDLAYDHRLNDGADAAEFVHRLKTILGDPGQFMLLT